MPEPHPLIADIVAPALTELELALLLDPQDPTEASVITSILVEGELVPRTLQIHVRVFPDTQSIVLISHILPVPKARRAAVAELIASELHDCLHTPTWRLGQQDAIADITIDVPLVAEPQRAVIITMIWLVTGITRAYKRLAAAAYPPRRRRKPSKVEQQVADIIEQAQF